jgi:hypothetical protein
MDISSGGWAGVNSDYRVVIGIMDSVGYWTSTFSNFRMERCREGFALHYLVGEWGRLRVLDGVLLEVLDGNCRESTGAWHHMTPRAVGEKAFWADF